MDTQVLLDLVKKFNDNRTFITNEETAKMALVVPFVRALGYDPNNPREVRLEYTAEFTQGDGKRHADRMDFAIFDSSGEKPLMVIETKPLGTNLRSSCQQLARYLAQMSNLHFGIMTDGCNYLLYGDLESPNQMDGEPFFSFSLDDPSVDWSKVAKFLAKFSRDSFNSETLLTDAENSRYRQAMIDKIVSALRSPTEDEGFMKWLTDGVYKGKRTTGIMARMGDVARESIEPALLRVMSDDFLQKLRERMQKLEEAGEGKPSTGEPVNKLQASAVDVPTVQDVDDEETLSKIDTTDEEIEFHRIVCSICSREGIPAEQILYKDTVNYFNVSYLRPTKWFVRFFAGSRTKSIITNVLVDEAKELASGFKVEEAPGVFGNSRVYIDTVGQLWALKSLIIRSLALVRDSNRGNGGDL